MDIEMMSTSREEQEDERQTEDCALDKDLVEARDLLQHLMNDPNTADEVISSECMRRIARRIEEEKQSMRHNPTACLWLMYIDMVPILQSFIKVERTGNWDLHLQTVHHMLPYFAAAGHNLYPKSAYLYLQKMTELKEDHPDVYKNFMEGSFVLRRTDRYWAGLNFPLILSLNKSS